MQIRGCIESKAGRACSAGGLVVQVGGVGSAGRAGSTSSAGWPVARVGLVWLVVYVCFLLQVELVW